MINMKNSTSAVLRLATRAQEEEFSWTKSVHENSLKVKHEN